ncbi:dol-P-Man:Man(5)GlcNAc(2)-PP-Dol alpha-1,3-mannosyltransferase [Monosporozyma servazzii]
MVDIIEKSAQQDEPVVMESQPKQTQEPAFVRPPIDLIQDIKDGINYILFDPAASLIVGPLLLILESAAIKIITKKVAYTEIDYEAYMEQIDMIKYQGNYNYTEIRGGTGPLVYPAGHVFIYKMMYWLTNGMEDIHNGQVFFRYIYLVTMALQFLCYHNLELPPWCMVLACLSKRLHSIYVLRLFNDCFTTFFMVLTVTLLLITSEINNSKWKMKSIVTLLCSFCYTIAVSVKMNALLYLPGVLVSIFILTDNNILLCLLNGIVMVAWQVIIALPFLKTYPWSYIDGAFNFKRQFMYVWSINWQFMDEETFNDTLFQNSLLISQVVLTITIILMKYPSLFRDIFSSITLTKKRAISVKNPTSVIAFVLIMSNFIGIIFSRSLHYQFLSWYHWTIPILMNWSGLPVYIGSIWYLCHEYCWNSYPPNSNASLLLFMCNCTLMMLIFIKQFQNKVDDEFLKDKKSK